MNPDPSPCADCGADTTPCTGKRGCRHAGKWEYYAVTREIWARVGAGKGYLCIGCLEQRLGRMLTSEDFADYPVNWPSPWDTARIAEAKNRPPASLT